MVLSTKRPKDVTTLHVFRTGTSNNNMEFLRDDECAYYLERPGGGEILQYDRRWQFNLYRGKDHFSAAQEPIFRIFRNQPEANIQFFLYNGDLAFTMEWAGKGDVGGLTAAPKQHFFFWKGRKYEWSEHSHLTGNDLVCRDAEAKETVAYFRSVMTPQTKEGKLEVSCKIDEGFQDVLVVTCIAYREWTIRRAMVLFGDQYYNQSVSV